MDNEMDNSLTILVNETQKKPIKYKIDMDEKQRFILSGILYIISFIININFIILRNTLPIFKIIWYFLYLLFSSSHFILTYKEDNIIYIKDNIILTILFGISILFQFSLLIVYEDSFVNLSALIISSIYNLMYNISYYYNLYYK